VTLHSRHTLSCGSVRIKAAFGKAEQAMKAIAIILMVCAASGVAFGKLQNVPLPRAKPNSSAAQIERAVPIIQQGEPTSANSPCSRILREIAEFKALPDITGPGECGAGDRVQLEAIKMPDGSRVAMTPPATLRCPMAESIAEWVRSDLGQAAREHGSALKAVVASGSYDCRPRNGVKGARISEHGRGNAMDLAALKLANSATLDLTRDADSKPFRDRARASACSRFTTVLGPGADAQHENHIHVDLAVRNRGHRVCQWDVRDAPMVASAPAPIAAPPPPRTLAAAKASPSQLRPPLEARAPSQPAEAVPLPLRRPFELVFAMRK
jgi:hypothetical protein